MRYPIFNPQHSWGVSSVASLFFYIRDLLQEAFFFSQKQPALPSQCNISQCISACYHFCAQEFQIGAISMMLKFLVH